MKFRNFTPHTIVLNDGTEYLSEGIARVSAKFSKLNDNGCCQQQFGKVEGLPKPEAGTVIIVSAMVLSAASNRDDLVAPATGHPETRRNEAGHIISVPGFVCNKPRICKNCKSWYRHREDTSRYGHCPVLNGKDSPVAVQTMDYSGGGIITTPEFGCNKFEEENLIK